MSNGSCKFQYASAHELLQSVGHLGTTWAKKPMKNVLSRYMRNLSKPSSNSATFSQVTIQRRDHIPQAHHLLLLFRSRDRRGNIGRRVRSHLRHHRTRARAGTRLVTIEGETLSASCHHTFSTHFRKSSFFLIDLILLSCNSTSRS